MLKKIITAIIAALTASVVLSSVVFAQSSIKITVIAAYPKGNGVFAVVVKDTPGTKLDMYVNDAHPVFATVNRHDYATFKTALSGSGKLSFTRLVTSNHATTQKPVSYTKNYSASNTSVRFISPVTTTTEQVSTTQAIAFTTTTQSDSSLASGQTNVLQAGHNGIETLVYTVTYKNGNQISKTLSSQSVTTPAVNQIVENGTYVAPAPTQPATTESSTSSDTGCTNGTYVNTDGNTVCSPETSPSVPAGATAECVDGTYSFSQHHSGTCSDHGGVAQWL